MRTYMFKWPATGHPTAERILQQNIAQDSLAHAYLIYGPEGIGKKDIASLFVATLVCLNPSIRPCDACDACRQLAQGLHPDVHWVSPESGTENISVDQIRALKQTLHLRSISSTPKIGGILAAESMTTIAANALLKLLEEPPQGVILVLVAHSLASIPATVLSRCQLIHCKPLSEVALREILDPLSTDRALTEMIIASSFGRVRYARSILADGGTQYQARTNEMLQLLESPLLGRLLRTTELAKYESPESAELTGETLDESADSGSLDILESLLRDVALIRSGAQGIAHTSYRERLARIAASLSITDIYHMLAGIADLRQRLGTYAHAQLAWEHFFINI